MGGASPDTITPSCRRNVGPVVTLPELVRQRERCGIVYRAPLQTPVPPDDPPIFSLKTLFSPCEPHSHMHRPEGTVGIRP